MKKKIKIVRILSRFCIGGPTIHTTLLTRYLPKDKYETTLLGGELEYYEKYLYRDFIMQCPNVHIVDIMKRDVNVFDDLRAVFRLLKILRREKPDIVHTHTAKAGTTGRLAAILMGVPIILHTFHGHVFEHYFGKFKTRLFVFVERFLALWTTRIIAISPLQKKDLAEKFKIAPENKIACIRLGFELDRFLDISQQQHNRLIDVPQDHHIMAIIARIVPIKNHQMAVRVLQHLIKQGIKMHLCIVGDGDNRKNIEHLCKELHVEDYVHFLGWTENMIDVYRGIDFLILCSLNEGTPVVLIEAMAAGVPIVATRVGGVPDLLDSDRNGMSSQVNDYECMADNIKMLLENKQKKKILVQQAKIFVIRNFSYHRLIKDIDELYQKLLRKYVYN